MSGKKNPTLEDLLEKPVTGEVHLDQDFEAVIESLYDDVEPDEPEE